MAGPRVEVSYNLRWEHDASANREFDMQGREQVGEADMDRHVVESCRSVKRCRLCEQARSMKCVGPCTLRDVDLQMARARENKV
jgi:hypothetical protein